MKTIFLIPLVLFTILSLSGFASAAPVCTTQKLNGDLVGDWKGTDTYLLRIQKTRRGQTCFSIEEPGASISRDIRDVVIQNGTLMHLTYYTPSTNGYVVYANIKVTNDSLDFDWFSSYDLASGKDKYIRLPRSSSR